jgi:hypothetical protein
MWVAPETAAKAKAFLLALRGLSTLGGRLDEMDARLSRLEAQTAPLAEAVEETLGLSHLRSLTEALSLSRPGSPPNWK